MYYVVSLARQNQRGDIVVRYEYVNADKTDSVIEWVDKQNKLLIDGYEVMAILEVSKEEYERNSG